MRSYADTRLHLRISLVTMAPQRCGCRSVADSHDIWVIRASDLFSPHESQAAEHYLPGSSSYHNRYVATIVAMAFQLPIWKSGSERRYRVTQPDLPTPAFVRKTYASGHRTIPMRESRHMDRNLYPMVLPYHCQCCPRLQWTTEWRPVRVRGETEPPPQNTLVRKWHLLMHRRQTDKPAKPVRILNPPTVDVITRESADFNSSQIGTCAWCHKLGSAAATRLSGLL